MALLGRRHPPRITRYAVPGVRETCTKHKAGKLETEALTHLRNSGNYLAPGGFLDMIYMPALLLRG
ncbi:MAG: hypothetical protein R3322_18100, partial [Kiloniellales bacterium]|nr:hypothetical protein [Kiloniellales bacterium]